MIRKKKETKPIEKKPKIYSIVSVPEFFRRSGMLFTKDPTLLTEDKMTPEILVEKWLTVTEVTENPETKKVK